jgi:abortive infection bacteriophage resistance protein
MLIDIRKYLEVLVKNPKYDYSIPNSGGDEIAYNNIKWYDKRPKPTWEDILNAYHKELAELAAKAAAKAAEQASQNIEQDVEEIIEEEEINDQ